MNPIRCAEIWGGIEDADLDVCTNTLTASLYSGASDGGKGGDIYYFSVCGRDMLTRVAVADVVGHGEVVSSVSQWLYDALVARMDSLDGSAVLVDLNHVANERGLKALTTAAVISFYAANSNLYFSYAGHPPLLIRRRQDKQWRPALLKPHTKLANLPLGATDSGLYDQEQMPLVSGDRLFLYTDGLIEPRGADGRVFGEARLLAVLEEVGEASLYELKNGVLAAVRRHTGGALTHDDITLMAMEVR